jgi:hypothetical protein
MPGVLIATPTRARSMDMEYMVGLMHSQGIYAKWMPMGGQTDVYIARNILLNNFRREPGDFDQLVYIDSDIGFTRDDLVKLVTCGAHFVCGVYTDKGPGRNPVFFPMEGSYTRETLPKEGLLRAKYIPAGFTCIHRSVLQKMIDAKIPEPYGPMDNPNYRFFYGPLIEDRNLLSEDYSLSKMVRQVGVQPYLHCGIRLKHDGFPA